MDVLVAIPDDLTTDTKLPSIVKFYASHSFDLNGWVEKYKVGTVSTAGELCFMLSALELTHEQINRENFNLYMTKGDIVPFWETLENKNGGRWSFIVYRPKEYLLPLCVSYVNCLLMTMYCSFAMSNDPRIQSSFCNLIFTIKKRYFKVSVWVEDLDDTEAVNAVGDKIMEILTTTPRFKDLSLPQTYDLQRHGANSEDIIEHHDVIYSPCEEHLS